MDLHFILFLLKPTEISIVNKKIPCKVAAETYQPSIDSMESF